MMRLPQLPALLHPEIFKGDSWKLSVTIDQDLTDHTVTASIHPRAGGEDVELAIANKIDGLEESSFDVVLTAAKSADLEAAYHSWCLIITPPFVEPELPKPRTFFAGRFIVRDCDAN